MAVSREYAEQEVERFNHYYNTLTDDEKRDYYGNKPASIKSYEQCFRCGGSYTNFRPSKPDECPTGSTIGPIIKA